MFALAQGLAIAKSRQDVAAALTFLAPDMLLENPAFGTSVRGLPDNERALTRWFKMFPDYHVVLAGRANNADTLICWGKVQMTMTGGQLGVAPNGRRVELPVYIQFTFKDDRIASERFFFDLSELCAQSGVSTDLVRQKLFGSAHASSLVSQEAAV
jgi:predicted ester cyclase